MVAINQDNKSLIVADVVCPNCFKPMQNPTILPQRKDSYERELRNYFGYCFECNLGFEVVQFKRKFATENTEDNCRWVIHKFQAYKYAGDNEKCEKFGNWIVLNELPEPAPVVIGPGGDFNKQIKLKQFEILKTMRKSLKALCQTIDCTLKAFKYD